MKLPVAGFDCPHAFDCQVVQAKYEQPRRRQVEFMRLQSDAAWDPCRLAARKRCIVSVSPWFPFDCH